MSNPSSFAPPGSVGGGGPPAPPQQQQQQQQQPTPAQMQAFFAAQQQQQQQQGAYGNSGGGTAFNQQASFGGQPGAYPAASGQQQQPPQQQQGLAFNGQQRPMPQQQLQQQQQSNGSQLNGGGGSSAFPSFTANGAAPTQQQQPAPVLSQQQQQQQPPQPGQPGFAQHPLGPPGFPALPPGFPPHMAAGLSRARMTELLQRMAALKAQGLTEQSSPELGQLGQIIKLFQKLSDWNKVAAQAKQRQMQQQQQQQQAGRGAGGAHNAGVNPNASAPGGPQMSASAQSLPGAPAPTGAVAPPLAAAAATNGPPGGPTTTAHFTAEQIATLRAQMHTYKLLGKNVPIPAHLQAAILGNAPGGPGPQQQGVVGERLGDELTRKLVEGVADVQHQVEGRQTQRPKYSADLAELDQALVGADGKSSSSTAVPFGAFTHPLTVLAKHTPTSAFASAKQQRLLMPSVLPAGLDPYILLEERERAVQTRIDWRIAELESLSAMLGERSGPAEVKGLVPAPVSEEGLLPLAEPAEGAKRRALIELKGLQLVDKQRRLRETALRSLDEAGVLTTDRAVQKKVKKHAQRDARRTEELERRQRTEREKKVKQKQNDYVEQIVRHGRELVKASAFAADKGRRLGRMVLSYHVTTEKEEQKRVERISKERLRALKADDEEAYMALLDTAKDTRITHLLRQTDAFLDSLAQAVVAQQNDDVHLHGGLADEAAFETEDGPADEAMFGAVNMVDEVGDEDGASAPAAAAEGGAEGAEGAAGKPKVDYYAVAHRISEKITAQPTILVGGTLKEYQIKGLQWMVSLYNNRLNGILADEMGLGKTIQTLSLITFLIEKKQQRGPFLVIVPLSTITNWTLEFEKWAPSVSTVIFKGTPQARRDAAAKIKSGNFQVVITTFEYIIREKALLGKIKWVHMIIDEGHRMKNTQSKLSQTLTQHYTSRYRLILTGTPLQNNLPELWALLNFVLPKVFNSVKSFDEWFNTPFANTGTSDKIDINEEEQLLIIRRLHKVLRPFLLRRLKKDVESELPDKVEKVIKCRMSALQQRVYTTYRKHGFLASEGNDKTGKSNVVKGLNNTLMQLRKICNHPFVIGDIEDSINPTRNIDDSLWRTSGKFELLDRILPKLFATGHRVLIFFQMVQIMHIFADYCTYKGWGGQFLHLDGSTKAEDRTDMIVKFNHPESPHKLFILSTRAGGLGLNLQTADTVIIFDSDWNPHADLQAQDRAHRIGQKKVVKIFRLITNKSIEEDIYSAAQGKLAIDGKVIQAGKFDNKSSAAEQEALLRSLLEAENDEGDEEDNGEMGDEEINELLARGEHEVPIFKQLDEQREDEALQRWTASGGVGPVPDRLFTDEEVPEFYKKEFQPKQDESLLPEEGRGHRARADVRYDDGLTEEQFLNAVEDEEGGLEAAMERAARRGAGRRTQAAFATDDDDDDEGSVSSAFEKPKRGRGRPAKNKQRILDDDEEDEASSATTDRRKRPRQSRATTFDDDDDSGVPTSKRRKTGGPNARAGEMKETLMNIYTALANLPGSETGGLRSAAFLTAVDKKLYPQYYVLIPKPVFMSQIKRRVQNGTYKDVGRFAEDFRQMFENARAFNEEGSWVWNDALALERELEDLWANLVAGSGLPGAPPAANSTAGVSTPATDASTDVGGPAAASGGGKKITLKLGGKRVAPAVQQAPAPSEDDDDDDDDDEGSASSSDSG